MTRPWLPVCLAFIAGILLAPLDSAGLLQLKIALLLTTAAALGAALWGRRTSALLFIMISFALSGAALHTSAVTSADPHHLANLIRSNEFDFSQPVRITGILAHHPDRRPNLLQLDLAVERIEQAHKSQTARGGLLVNVHLSAAWNERALPFRTGDRVQLIAQINLPRPPGNPGGFAYDLYLLRNGITAIAHVKSPLAVRILSRGHGLPGAAQISSLRAALMGTVERDFSPTGQLSQRGALLQAMLLGQRGMISDETKHLLQRTGLLHIIAISGLHVWLLGFVVFMALRSARLSDRWVSLLTIAAIAFYWVLAGGRSSAGRACLVAIVFLAGRFFYRRADLINNLAFAALVILVVTPTELFSPAFQLTFSAALSICLLYPPLNRLLGPLGWIGSALAVSFAALFGTFPLSAMYFNIATLHGAITTSLLIPAITLVIFIGFLYLLLAFLFPFSAGLLAGLVDFLLGITLEAASLFDRALPAAIRLPSPPPWLAVAYYLALLAVPFLAAKTKRTFTPFLPLLILLVLLVWNPFIGPPIGDYRLHAIDVGQGESLLLELPDGSAALIDGGGAAYGDFDVGEYAVSDFLWSRGRRRIELMVSTHSDSDHIDGLISVARNFDIGEIWVTTAPEENEKYLDLIRIARQKEWKVRRLARGDRIIWRSTAWTCLNPPNPPYRGRNASNANSLVTLVQAGNWRILLTGDAAAAQLDDIAKLYGLTLHCDVLKVPHHGSDDSLSTEFLNLANPQYALISSGYRNVHGFPRQTVLEALDSRQIKVLRTDLQGALSLTLGSNRISVSTGLTPPPPPMQPPRRNSQEPPLSSPSPTWLGLPSPRP
jgi:competence protein ComEC